MVHPNEHDRAFGSDAVRMSNAGAVPSGVASSTVRSAMGNYSLRPGPRQSVRHPETLLSLSTARLLNHHSGGSVGYPDRLICGDCP